MIALRPTPFKNLGLAVASTLIFLGLIEGLARLAEPPPVQKQEYLWDWSERFKDREFYTLEKGEGFPPDEENNIDGLRDVTRPVETRADLNRVVVLGDSVAYGHGLDGRDAFPQLLERTLRASGHDIDVFNLALPGWSTRQERIAYERIARKYKPTSVLLAVCLNDFAELQINLARPPGFLLPLFKHSAAVRLAIGASKREIGAVEELFTASGSARVENSFRLFFDEVKALRSEVGRDGATLQIVVFPFRFQVEPHAPPPSVQARIAEFAAAEKISFFDFLPEVSKSTSPTVLFLDYDHFTKQGHERVAQWLSSLPEVSGEARFAGEPTAPSPALVSAIAMRLELAKAESEGAREASLGRIQIAAVSLLERSGSDLAPLKAAVTAQAVDDPSPRVRFAAAETAFALGAPDERSVETLIRGLRHEDPRVRAFATWTLGEAGEVARLAVPALVSLARQDGGAGKTGALTAIGKIGGESPLTIPLLLQELKHPKEARRYRAARTIGKMGPSAASAVPGLTLALNDPSALVRLHVVRAFGNLGEASGPALPALIEILNNDPDPEVRKEVSLTLSKLPGR